jgi:hypothetical protein
MSKGDVKDLLVFLRPYPETVRELNQYRYIVVKEKADFPKTYIKKLLKEAYANSLAKVKDNASPVKGQTIVKAIYSKKKRPGIG